MMVAKSVIETNDMTEREKEKAEAASVLTDSITGTSLMTGTGKVGVERIISSAMKA